MKAPQVHDNSLDDTERAPLAAPGAQTKAGPCPCCGRYAVRATAQPGRVCRYRSLLDCATDDLLLLDVPMTSAPCTDRTEIKRRDRLFAEGVPASYAEWLAGPLWRHCPQVDRVDFHWDLETQCPVPGSYALHAVATVQSSQRADRQFSLFRLGRYDPAQLAHCLSALGWEEVGAELYGGEHSLRLYRKRHEGQRAGSGATRAWAGERR